MANGAPSGGRDELSFKNPARDLRNFEDSEFKPYTSFPIDSVFSSALADLPQCYQFALKTLKARNANTYKTELIAFRGLRNQEGIVRCFGDYSHEGQGNVPETTCNILLEFGDLDLDEFFAERSPPILPSEIVDFWKDLFEISEAVQRIHNLEIRTDGLVQDYNGYIPILAPLLRNLLTV